MSQQIHIKLKSFDHRLLDHSVKEILTTVMRSGASDKYRRGIFSVCAFPLPTNIKHYTVNRSPHVNKTSRDQYEIRSMTRAVLISLPTKRVVDALSSIELPHGVDIKVDIKTKSSLKGT